MRVLVVAPYPPARDGIGAYALQQVTTLRAAGDQVEVLSPLPSAAHHHLELRGWRGPLALAKRVRRYDRVIVHFHVDLFYPVPPSRRDKVAVTAALATAFEAARRLDLIVHEIDYSWGRRRSLRALVRAMLGAADHVFVHTATERALLTEAFALAPGTVSLLEHGRDFIRRTALDREAARVKLGLPTEDFIFLAIGFIQPHKGLDRAIRCFADLASHGARLYIVGSVRVEDPAYMAHLDELRRLAEQQRGVEIRAEYVSDERFDEWLVAADAVLLPYRFIWSSGVLERARLYGRPVIASDVGGLRDQGYDRLTAVEGDEELTAAMAAAAGRAPRVEVVPLATAPDAFDVPLGSSREEVLTLMRARAAGHRRAALGPVGSGLAPSAAPPAAVAPLLRLGPIGGPALESRSPLRGQVKRWLHRAIRWETDPLRAQLNALRQATLDVTTELAARTPPQDQSGPR